MTREAAPKGEGAELLLALRGYAGPLGALVALARAERIDLRRVGLAAAAAQAARLIGAGPLERAAEALALVAELAFLKARLLLPAPAVPGPPPRALDAALALARRRAMQAAAERLADRPRLGREVFARGLSEGEIAPGRSGPVEADALALVRAYAAVRLRETARAPLALRRVLALTLARALATLGERIETLEGWTDWDKLLAPLRAAPEARRADPRSVSASAFAAALELAREGRVELRQGAPFGPIELRRRRGAAAGGAAPSVAGGRPPA